jgi:hypothetical protein
MVGVKWLALRIKERERRRRGMPWGLTAAAAIKTLLSTAMFFLGFLAIFAFVLVGGTADPLKAGGL